jgi:hypothetical protein
MQLQLNELLETSFVTVLSNLKEQTFDLTSTSLREGERKRVAERSSCLQAAKLSLHEACIVLNETFGGIHRQ